MAALFQSRQVDARGPGAVASMADPRRRAAPVPMANQQRSPTKRRDAPAATAQPVKEKPKKPVQEKPINLPDPPEVMIDEQGTRWYRGNMLGSGGFARVYDAQSEAGEHIAVKVIAKLHLRSRKARSKILAEIMIHSSLKHHHIVNMLDTFEDDHHVYFKMELCKGGSMNDMVKKRKKYTDEEARYFMIQILSGCQGMHTHNVIHRDLKLGNIFLDENMNVKIGDFGLAALLKDEGERKKTVCGTPNYIAPEVLYDEGEGHSFEVDVWSVGVILYTMLVGKPPFQTSDIQTIYEKIKKNDYEIPERANVRPQAQDLITRILAPRPSDRPSLIQIMNHPWFTCAPIPYFVPRAATHTYTRLSCPQTQSENLQNFDLIKNKAGWIPNADDLVEDDEEELDPREELKHQEALEAEREKMDRQFLQAIQPASPISALLQASRQPLVKATSASSSAKSSGAALARQLQALSISRAQSGGTQNLASAATTLSKGNAGGAYPAPAQSKTAPLAVVDKENARPLPTSGSTMGPPAVPFGSVRRGLGSGLLPEPDAEERRMLGQKARLVAGMTGAGSNVNLPSSGRPNTAPTSDEGDEEANFATPPPSRRSVMEVMIHYMGEAIQAGDTGVDYQPLEANGNKVTFSEQAEHPRVFVISWLDHSERYGLGYALSDGTVGVYFRDATSIAINCNRTHCDYVASHRRSARVTREGGLDLKRHNFTLEGYLEEREKGVEEGEPSSAELHPKVKVLRFFEQEIMSRFYASNSPLTYRDEEMDSGMVFVHRWHRTNQAIIFRLSTGVIQFNFFDHTKMFISECGLVYSMIPPVETTKYMQTMYSYGVAEIVAIAHPDRSSHEAQALAEADEKGTPVDLRITTPTERRMVRNMLKRMRNCRAMLTAWMAPAPGASNRAVSTSSTSSAASAASAATTKRDSVNSTKSATASGATLQRSASTGSVRSNGTSRTVQGACR